jgi:hypothetical protein
MSSHTLEVAFAQAMERWRSEALLYIHNSVDMEQLHKQFSRSVPRSSRCELLRRISRHEAVKENAISTAVLMAGTHKSGVDELGKALQDFPAHSRFAQVLAVAEWCVKRQVEMRLFIALQEANPGQGQGSGAGRWDAA